MQNTRRRAEVRARLTANHASAPTYWLVTLRRHHRDDLAHEPVVKELQCWVLPVAPAATELGKRPPSG